MNDMQLSVIFFLVGGVGVMLCALIENSTNKIIDEIKRLRERER